MGSSGFGRALAGSVAVVLSLGVAPGCGPSIDGYCDKLCDCVGCSETERDDCVDTLEDARKDASDAGCAGEFDAVFSCVNAETTCVDDTIDADGCDTEAERLVECSGGSIGPSCNTLCEEAQKCDGAAQTDCTKACANAKELNEASGCSAKYDAIVLCSAAEADVCNPSSACNDEASVYVECVIKFCNENPMAPACN